MIYHLLTESEPLSERVGGAIARWVANAATPGAASVICPADDRSYGLPAECVRVAPELARYKRMRRWAMRLPARMQEPLIRRVFSPLLAGFRRGDMLWVHNRPEYACALAELLGKRGVKTVLHMHNSHLLNCTARQLAILSEMPIVFCSKFLHDQAVSLFSRRSRGRYVLYNGADPRRFYPAASKNNAAPQVVFAGRLVPEKGAHVLLDAMRRLAEAGVEATCCIIGSAGFGTTGATKYMRQLEALKPGNAVMAGYLAGDALAERFREADIFCCPSTWQEPLGLTNLEAMASGLPVIASRVGGIPEVFPEGGGILVEPSDAAALACALRPVIEDRQLRQDLGTRAMASFRGHFSWEKVRESYSAIVSEIST